MPEDYNSEVARQPSDPLREREIQEFRLWLEVMRGNQRNRGRILTRFKVIAVVATSISAFATMWDWIKAGLLKVLTLGH